MRRVLSVVVLTISLIAMLFTILMAIEFFMLLFTKYYYIILSLAVLAYVFRKQIIHFFEKLLNKLNNPKVIVNFSANKVIKTAYLLVTFFVLLLFLNVFRWDIQEPILRHEIYYNNGEFLEELYYIERMERDRWLNEAWIRNYSAGYDYDEYFLNMIVVDFQDYGKGAKSKSYIGLTYEYVRASLLPYYYPIYFSESINGIDIAVNELNEQLTWKRVLLTIIWDVLFITTLISMGILVIINRVLKNPNN